MSAVRFRLSLQALALVTAFGVAGSAAVLTPAPALAQAPTTNARGLPDFTDLVDLVGPSVVNIRTLERASARGGAEGGADEEMLEFFRRFGIPIPPGVVPRGPRQGPPSDEARPRGVGSGFVLSADGFVMTNAHVVDGADEVIVTLTDKREFKARIVGADTRTDVAVVKIEATGLVPVKVGDINRLRVGEWVMAIGSPFGLENTVTAGIVSAKQRDTGDYLPFIQTDVAINPGNSGGPLINMRGEVVGINSQIYSRSGGFQGISFAIPIDEAVRVSNELRPISLPAPSYPREAERRRRSGSVEVEFTVGTDGNVTSARVVQASPPRVFDREALSAVNRWRFQPIGSPVTTRRTIQFKPAD